jgi:hypothetical protein
VGTGVGTGVGTRVGTGVTTAGTATAAVLLLELVDVVALESVALAPQPARRRPAAAVSEARMILGLGIANLPGAGGKDQRERRSTKDPGGRHIETGLSR